MQLRKFAFLLIAFCCFFHLAGQAQIEPEYRTPDPGYEMEDEEPEEEPDQPVKLIKPLIKNWYLDDYGAFKDSARLDTFPDFFHIYNPIYKGATTVGYLGNYATPYQNHNFFQRESAFDFYFLQSRDIYLLSPDSVKYFNTRTPYTQLDFTQSEHRTRKNETTFNVLHSRNINPFLNVTFRFDQARSEGQYQHQATKNNFVTLYSNYNRDKLGIHTGFISNSIKNNESGGLTRDDLIFSGGDTDFLDVNLNNTGTEFANTFVYGTGEYRVGRTVASESDTVPTRFIPFVGFIYSFEYQNNLRQFIEQEGSNDFFPNTYFSDDYFKDSVRFRKIQNVLQVKQYETAEKRTSFGKRILLGQEFVKASSPGIFEDERRTKRYSNVFAGGGIFRQEGYFWTWNFDGKIYLLGRNAGQTELSGVISKPFNLLGDSLTTLSITGRIENLVPDYFEEEYYSQHIMWNNNFSMEQRMVAGGEFESPARRFKLGADYAIINNFVYNNEEGIPSQTGQELLVLSAHVGKDFRYRNLLFLTRVLWQQASDERFVHLPALSAFGMAYYKFVLAKVLFSQIGVDTRYYTPYYADAYNPATGLFHLQNSVKTGGFPYIDAHVDLRLKRTRLFFKMMNIGMEFIDKEYFTVPHYPMPRRTYRFGISWLFYD